MRRMAVCRHIWPHMLAMAATYAVTLALYPGLESRLASCSLGSWLTLALMTVFNLTDLAGKVLASTSLSWSPPPGWLVAGPLARSVLVPLLLMAATRYRVQGVPGTFSNLALWGMLANYSSYS